MTEKSKLKWHKITNSCKMSKNYKFIENDKYFQIYRKWQTNSNSQKMTKVPNSQKMAKKSKFIENGKRIYLVEDRKFVAVHSLPKIYWKYSL